VLGPFRGSSVTTAGAREDKTKNAVKHHPFQTNRSGVRREAYSRRRVRGTAVCKNTFRKQQCQTRRFRASCTCYRCLPGTLQHHSSTRMSTQQQYKAIKTGAVRMQPGPKKLDLHWLHRTPVKVELQAQSPFTVHVPWLLQLPTVQSENRKQTKNPRVSKQASKQASQQASKRRTSVRAYICRWSMRSSSGSTGRNCKRHHDDVSSSITSDQEQQQVSTHKSTSGSEGKGTEAGGERTRFRCSRRRPE
jgi:hypothetical protein